MSTSQQQQAPPVSQTAPSSGTQDAAQLSIQEMLRVMDVAREMRKSREKAEEVLQRADFRAQLRDKLMRSAQLSGDRVTEAEIDAAIQVYLADRHRFQPPEFGFRVVVANLWVRRRAILGWTIATAATAATVWGLFFSTFSPF